MKSNGYKEISEWNYEYILQLVREGEKENVQLEYKSGDFIKATDDEGKFKLRKWVTSFANSAGGFLVIGVPEKKVNNERVPNNPDGIDKTKFKGDVGKWIEDVILNTVSIFPRLYPSLQIKEISMPHEADKVIVVMWIPQTKAVIHKVTFRGKDHYFHRHNFQVLQMDEWEIRALLFGRAPPPVIELNWPEKLGILCQVKDDKDIGGEFREITHNKFIVQLVNNGFGIGKYIQIGMVHPPDFEIFSPMYEQVKYDEKNRERPLKVPLQSSRTERSTFSEILSPLLKGVFEIRGVYYVTKINEKEVLHPGDSKNYVFSLRIKDYKKSSPEISCNLGVYTLAENSEPKYFEVIIKFNIEGATARPHIDIKEYNGSKIPIKCENISW